MKLRNTQPVPFAALVVVVIAGSLPVMTRSAHAEDTDSDRIGPNTTLTFAEKQAVLTQGAKTKLNALIKDANANGKINEIQVAAWSDNPAPRKDEQLSKPDRDLAEKRAKAVNAYIKNHAKTSVSTYNMAERASWLARIFDTSDAELKAEIGPGGKAPMSREEFQVFKNNGQPSKAVVLVIMKHE